MDKNMEVKPLTGENEVLETVTVSQEEIDSLVNTLGEFDLDKMTRAIAEAFKITEEQAKNYASKYVKKNEASKDLKVEEIRTGDELAKDDEELGKN